jgi:hypothetical protein
MAWLFAYIIFNLATSFASVTEISGTLPPGSGEFGSAATAYRSYFGRRLLPQRWREYFGRETFAVAENLIQAPAIGSITIEPV